ncbi:hypothetical protein NSTC745_03877 [Nostoc sp. DSM 114161]|jgi:hypothetical protein|uniref:hypothetical protein n=1 Tax=Nostoc sp. DSM 114161 TaxID=3440143 RepID=UPI004045E6E5
MARAAVVAHVIGAAPNQFLMDLPDVYDGIGTSMGVLKLTGDPPAGADKVSLQYAINTGKVFHVAVSYVVNGKRKRSKLICDRSHIGTALSIKGKTFRGQTITGAVIPSHITLG